MLSVYNGDRSVCQEEKSGDEGGGGEICLSLVFVASLWSAAVQRPRVSSINAVGIPRDVVPLSSIR